MRTRHETRVMGHVTLYQGGRKDMSQNTNVQEEGNSDKFGVYLPILTKGEEGISWYTKRREAAGGGTCHSLYTMF